MGDSGDSSDSDDLSVDFGKVCDSGHSCDSGECVDLDKLGVFCELIDSGDSCV